MKVRAAETQEEDQGLQCLTPAKEALNRIQLLIMSVFRAKSKIYYIGIQLQEAMMTMMTTSPCPWKRSTSFRKNKSSGQRVQIRESIRRRVTKSLRRSPKFKTRWRQNDKVGSIIFWFLKFFILTEKIRQLDGKIYGTGK